MNHGKIQLAEGELREPKKKKVKPGTLLRDPYPIIFWNKLGIPPCKELWPGYMGVFDGDSVIVEDPGDMHEISTMGYFGKRLMCRRGYEQSIGDVPVVRERQWKRRVEWAAECGYILIPPDKEPDASTQERVSEEEAKDADRDAPPADDGGAGCGGAASEDIRRGDRERGEEEDATRRMGEGGGAGEAEEREGERDSVQPGEAAAEDAGGRSIKAAESPAVAPGGEEGEGTKGVDSGGGGGGGGAKGGESPRRKRGEERPRAGVGCQGTRRSPRSTRSSAAAKPKESEPRKAREGPGVAGGADQGVTTGRARRSLRKILAREGEGDAADPKGDGAGGESDAKSGRRGGAPSNAGDGKEELSGDGEGKEEGAVGSLGAEEAVGAEGEASICKSDEKSKASSGKLGAEVDGGEVRSGEEAEETCKVGTKRESRRTSRGRAGKSRSSKRNRSPSPGGISPGCNVEEEEEGGEKSGEKASEDCSKAASKRAKTGDVAEEEKDEEQQQQEEVVVKAMEGGGGEGDGTDPRPKEEPESAGEAAGKEGSGSAVSGGEGEREGPRPEGAAATAEAKSSEANLNKGSSDCEIVEIEDEPGVRNPSAPTSETPSAEASLKRARESPEEDAPAADSDDDIMEVSVEEEEVRVVAARDGQAIVGRRKSGAAREGGDAVNGSTDRVKFQKMLSEIRKTLPRDIEVMQVNLKDVKEGEGAASKMAGNENDDDDVIEINLQKSEMMELEGGCSEEEGEAEYGGEQARCLQRRMRKESSGFRRRERLAEGGCGDSAKVKQEAEGTESVTTGMLGSDCEVAPCVVIPDSDSEADDAPGSPRLESDPSIFIPSLDVLQLIPEEAFFLAYGLGCLMVWDARNADLESSRCSDREEVGGSAPIDKETLSKDDCRDNLQLNHLIKKEDDQLGKAGRTAGVSSSEAAPNDSTQMLDDSNPIGHSEDKSSKSINGCDAGHLPESPDKSSVVSVSVNGENVENPMVVASKSDSAVVRESPNKSSEENKPSASHDVCPSLEIPVGPDSTKVNKESDDMPTDKTSEEEVDVMPVATKPDQVPVSAHAQQNENNVEPSVGESLSTVDDIGGSDKNITPKRNHKNGGSEKNSSCSAEERGMIRDSHEPPKENGDLSDPSITVIDLADSPPSRQWSKKGWSSQDEEEVIAMDADAHDVSLVDPESVPDHRSGRTLSSEYHRPMSIVALWNTFRSCRATLSSSAVPFETTYAVYHHFRAKRWVVKPGIRFGGDFLLYKDGPPFYHASYLVVIDSSGPGGESKLDWKMLSGMNRLTENIAKDLMLCRVEWSPTVTEKELGSPQCLAGLVVQEVLVRRWVSIKERVTDDQMEEEDDDQESFIPLQL